MGAVADHREGEDHKGRTVLVVEDDVLLRISTADHLRSRGYHVVEAGTAIEAATILSSRSPVHLVFSDVDLPGATGGLTLAVWLHTHYPAIPVVLTSGVRAVMPTLSDQRVIPFVPKPYDLDELSNLISGIIEGASASKPGKTS